MKNFLFSLLSLFFISNLFAQVPQVISYQAVATDNVGIELTENPISIRATILKGAINGESVWAEEHFTQTDEFGLFTIDIGSGERVGGSVEEFPEIPWNSGKFFLRIEMDPTGGNNFVLMGANQILSVPYSFFAERAGRADLADTADVANVSLVALSTEGDEDGDPTNELQTLNYENGMISISGGNELFIDVNDADSDPENEMQDLSFDGYSLSISGGNSISLDVLGFGGPGASSDFPQGIIGDFMILTNEQYQIPEGKAFYMTAGGPAVTIVGVGSEGSFEHSTTPNMPVFKEGRVITDCYCTGYTVDLDPNVEIEFIDLNVVSPVYTVPVGKILYLKSGLNNENTAYLKVNGSEMEFLRPNFTRGTRIIAFPSGTLIAKSATDSNDELILTGFLIDAP